VIETKRQSNQMIVGLNRPVGDGWANMVANYQRISNPALRQILESVNVSERPVDPRYTPLTDDRAPIEALIDSLIFEQVAP